MDIYLLYHANDLDKKKFHRIYETLSTLFQVIHFNQHELLNNELPYTKSYVSSPWNLSRQYVPWSYLFNICNDFRKQQNIPDSDMIILLNEQNNENNWFSAGQPGADGVVLPNSFIHTGNWEMFLPHDAFLPIAFTVIEEVIRYGMAINYHKFDQYSHTPSIGCINDMCQEKKDIILSMRTADLCERCVSQLLDTGRLSALQIHELMFGAEKIREQLLFRQGFRKWVGFSSLTLDDEARIMLPDYGQLQLQLNPMQKTLYVFFLLLPETGASLGSQSMSQFLQQHKAELMRLYQIFGGKSEQPIQNLIDNSWTQQVARIRKEINEKLCFLEENMRQQYVIMGEVNGPKRIGLSRNLVKLPNWLNTPD